MRRIKAGCKALLAPLAILLALLIFLSALSNANNSRREAGCQQLEDALRQAAAACYAAEGVYPPDVAYLQTHYGIQIDERQYTVHYEIFASNLMPEITVVEKQNDQT